MHGFRYTKMYGKARMEMKSALTFACMNLKNRQINAGGSIYCICFLPLLPHIRHKTGLRFMCQPALSTARKTPRRAAPFSLCYGWGLVSFKVPSSVFSSLPS